MHYLALSVRPRNAQSHSLVVKGGGGGTSGATACGTARAEGTCATAVRGFLRATGFLATALLFFFAAFLPADFNFRVRIACFFAALRFLGMGIPLVTGSTWCRSYDAYLQRGQVLDGQDNARPGNPTALGSFQSSVPAAFAFAISCL